MPGGTAGVYAIRHAGLAISVGIWSCVIVILSYVWGVWIFGEEQKSTWGAVCSVAVVCVGLCGSAYFSSREVEMKTESDLPQNQERVMKEVNSFAPENSPLLPTSAIHSDLGHLRLQGAVDFHETALSMKCMKQTCRVSKYHAGLCMAVVNGILASTIMVPLHYAPPTSTSGLGYSMSFGMASVVAVWFYWLLRYIWLASANFYFSLMFAEPGQSMPTFRVLLRIKLDSLLKGYQQLPSFHLKVMWKAGMTSGVLYSLGNLFGIVSIQNLGDFMGYSLNQSSVIVSGK